MSANSKIEWCDHSFNPWIGCTKVSPGCANCYAESYDKRWGGSHWGKGAQRKRTSAANWRKPVQWNAAGYICEACGSTCFGDRCMTSQCRGWTRRPRVFCASLADWLDDEVPAAWLFDLLTLIHKTPDLDWLLLTKRPENWKSRLKAAADQCTIDHLDMTDRIYAWLEGSRIWRNIWIGTTVEDQQRADERIPALLQIPARVRFLSCEPLLGPLYLESWQEHLPPPVHLAWLEGIDWVICGGESGPNARPMHPNWARSLRDQCAAAGTRFFFKQWGSWKPICPLYDENRDELENGSTDRVQAIEVTGEIVTDRQPDGTAWIMDPVGKTPAGRLLDRREHNEFPAKTQPAKERNAPEP